jgi:SAM-dependent methyltransferase
MPNNVNILRKGVRRLRRALWSLRWKSLNQLGASHECYLCGKRFHRFYPYRNGRRDYSSFIREMQMVGSDVVNFGCPNCHANDRERHLFLYFDRLKLWDNLKRADILHFAPERNLSRRLKELQPRRYVQADFFPEDLYGKNPEIERVDATNIQYGPETFDAIICNHVLEHVPDARKALSEFHRVLRPGGFAILQTPFSRRLARTFEDPGIDSGALRLAVYGQEDHARLFGRDFFNQIEAAGFQLKLCRHEEVSTIEEGRRFGMNVKEELVRVEKPGRV